MASPRKPRKRAKARRKPGVWRALVAPLERIWARWPGPSRWIAGALLLGLLLIYPPGHRLTRLCSLVLALALAAGLPWLFWRWRWVRWGLLALYTTLLVFWFLPGRQTHSRPLLREQTAQALARYEGTRFFRSGENGLGLDSAGLIRRGALDALMAEGVRSLNPYLARESAAFWWSAWNVAQLGSGAGGAARRLHRTPRLREADAGLLYPGDFAVLEDKTQALGYLGGGRWITTSSADGRALVLDVAQSTHPALEQPATLLRWRHLFLPRPKAR